MTIEQADQLLGEIWQRQGFMVIGCWDEQKIGSLLTNVSIDRAGLGDEMHRVPLKIVGASSFSEAQEQSRLVSEMTGTPQVHWSDRWSFYRVEAAD